MTFLLIDAVDRDGNPLGEVFVNVDQILSIAPKDRRSGCVINLRDNGRYHTSQSTDFIVSALTRAEHDSAGVVFGKERK